MKNANVILEGLTPLLVNRFHEAAQAEATAGVHLRHSDRPSPEDDARDRLYTLPDGGLYFPAENLRQAVITASGRQKIGRRSAATDVAAAILIEPFAMPLTGAWEVDARPVVIPATRGRMLRYRPIFASWSLEFTLSWDERLIDQRLVRQALDDAGSYVGVGDFRPQRKGPYGRFQVVRWEV